MSKGQRIKQQCEMKTQFSREDAIKMVLLLRQLLLEGPFLETNDSVPLRKKKKVGAPFRKMLSDSF